MLEDMATLDVEKVRAVGVAPARRRAREIDLELKKKVLVVKLGQDDHKMNVISQ